MPVRQRNLRSDAARNALYAQHPDLPRYAATLFAQRHPGCRLAYPLDDMVQDAAIAFLRAGELWDESRNVKFRTYAFRTIFRTLARKTRGLSLIHIPAYVWERHQVPKSLLHTLPIQYELPDKPPTVVANAAFDEYIRPLLMDQRRLLNGGFSTIGHHIAAFAIAATESRINTEQKEVNCLVREGLETVPHENRRSDWRRI